MNRKILTLLTAASFALFFGACGDDNGTSPNGPDIECVDGENCLDDEGDEISSSAKESGKSSSSKKGDSKSSSSVKGDSKSSASKDSDKSSASKDDDKSSASKDEDKSSTSKDDDKSSDSKEDDKSSNSKDPESSADAPDSSSDSKPSNSSSDAAPVSSSEEEKVVEYTNTTPNLEDLEVSGDTLFAIYQRLDADWGKHHNGLLALYKLSDGTLLDTIQLATKNPAAVKVVKGNVYVATTGNYYPFSDCGIEKVDLSKKTSSLFVSGTKLNGCPTAFAVDTKNNIGFVAASDASYLNKPMEVNLSTGSVKAIPGTFMDVGGGLEFDETTGTLYMGDRYMNWTTYEMYTAVFAYKDGVTTSLTDLDPEEEEMRQPYSIKAINGTPYVMVSDYVTAALYFNYQDDEDETDGELQFYQDSKLAVVDGELYVMNRNLAASGLTKINVSTKSVAWDMITIGKNPHDIVSAGNGKAWVAYYDTPILELINTADMSNVAIIDTKEFCAVKVEE